MATKVSFEFPASLSDETRVFMTDVMKELNKRGEIQNIDLGALRMLATSYELYKQSTEILLEEGPVVIDNHKTIANPAQTIATKNYAQVVKIMTEYGLTVKSRSKLISMKDKLKSTTPLAGFQQKNRKNIERR